MAWSSFRCFVTPSAETHPRSLEYELLSRLSHALGLGALVGAAAEDEAVMGTPTAAEAIMTPAAAMPRDRPERLLRIEDSFVIFRGRARLGVAPENVQP